jgi:hypothetical protein
MPNQDRDTSRDGLVAAWSAAAKDLGLDIERDVRLPAGGDQYVVWPLLIRNFGTSRGTVIDVGNATGHRSEVEAAQVGGVAYSFLSPRYEVYDRELFIATLNDWGWRGPADPPPWYTGRTWS